MRLIFKKTSIFSNFVREQFKGRKLNEILFKLKFEGELNDESDGLQ